MFPDACRRARSIVGAIRGRVVVGRSERLGGEEPVQRAPKAGEPARVGDNGEFPDHQFGSRDDRPGLAPSREEATCWLPKGDQAKTLPSGDTAMRQRMVHFSEYSGRVEEIYLLEDRPTELVASISIADAE